MIVPNFFCGLSKCVGIMHEVEECSSEDAAEWVCARVDHV